MMGCLTLPLRLAAGLLLVVGLVAGWFYRAEIERFGRRQLGMAEPPSPVGRPTTQAAETAGRRVDSLVRSRADSVVLLPAEVAALLARALGRGAGAVPDSLEVELGDRDVVVRALLPTAPLPGAIRDILGGVLRDRERVELAGPVGLRRAGVGEWEVRRVRVRGVPIPGALIERLVAPYAGREVTAVVPFEVPMAVTGIRVGPRGMTLYGGAGR